MGLALFSGCLLTAFGPASVVQYFLIGLISDIENHAQHTQTCAYKIHTHTIVHIFSFRSFCSLLPRTPTLLSLPFSGAITCCTFYSSDASHFCCRACFSTRMLRGGSLLWAVLLLYVSHPCVASSCLENIIINIDIFPVQQYLSCSAFFKN